MTVQRLRRWGTRALPTDFDTQTHAQDVGGDGDLVQVKVSALQTSGDPDVADDWNMRYVQYRYHGEGLLKSALTSDGIARLIADRADINVPSGILSQGDDDDPSGAAPYRIRDYASRQFTYHAYDVKTDNSEAGTPRFWCQSWKLEESGQKLDRLAEYRTPAAHNVTSSSVDEFLNPSHNGDDTNDTNTLQASVGLFQVFEHNTSGDVTGERIKQGRSGTAYSEEHGGRTLQDAIGLPPNPDAGLSGDSSRFLLHPGLPSTGMPPRQAGGVTGARTGLPAGAIFDTIIPKLEPWVPVSTGP